MSGVQSALPGNSVFMNKIEANDLKLVWRFIFIEMKGIVAKITLGP